MSDRAEALAEELRRQLQTATFGRSMEVLETTTSTQDVARRLAGDGCPEGQLVWALEQSAGRGRLDRRWVSAPGAGLWFSLVLRPLLSPNATSFLPLAAGVGIATALASHVSTPVRLKWPNDLLLRGRKLGGILVEAETAGGELRFAVLGVGVNLVLPEGVESALGLAALGVSGAAPDPAGVLAGVLLELERCYTALRDGTDVMRERWLELSDTIGRRVRAELPGGTIEGTAVDLAPDGALLVLAPGGEPQAVRYGDVVHLRPGA